MFPICKVKNIDSVAATYCGKTLQPNEIYSIQDTERTNWIVDDNVLLAVTDSKLAVGGDDLWYETISEQIACLRTEMPKDYHNKLFVHETTRPSDCTTCWIGEGDDLADVTKVGDGQAMVLKHAIGNDNEQSIYIDFNMKENHTYVHEGFLFWKDAIADKFSAKIVPTLTPTAAGENTYFNLYGGYLIVPAAGDGTVQINIEDIKLVEMPKDQNTGQRATAFWNADYNTETHQFSNITPAPNGDGVYNIFAVEVSFNDFVRKVPLIGSSDMCLKSADAHEIGHNMRIKFTIFTNDAVSDHEWYAMAWISMHRNRTY